MEYYKQVKEVVRRKIWKVNKSKTIQRFRFKRK